MPNIDRSSRGVSAHYADKVKNSGSRPIVGMKYNNDGSYAYKQINYNNSKIWADPKTGKTYTEKGGRLIGTVTSLTKSEVKKRANGNGNKGK